MTQGRKAYFKNIFLKARYNETFKRQLSRCAFLAENAEPSIHYQQYDNNNIEDSSNIKNKQTNVHAENGDNEI